MSNGSPTVDIAARLQRLEQNLTARITTLEMAQPATLARIDALENGPNLAGRIDVLEAAQARNRAAPEFTQQQTIAHEHAGQWVRMVQYDHLDAELDLSCR
jgi:hypothetical protein